MTPVKIVRAIICTAGVFAALAIVGGMSILNYRFAARLTEDNIDQVVYGLMAVALVFVGTIVWLMIEAAWTTNRKKTAVGLGIAGVVFAGWALTMSAGHIGSSRIMAGKGSHYADDRATALKKSETALQAELVALGNYRDAGRIKSDLKIMRDSFSWVVTDGCKVQKNNKHRQFCKTYNDRQGELSTAEKAERISSDLRVVQAKIEGIGAGRVGDGQARVLGGLILASTADVDNGAEEAVSRWLSLAQAVVSLFAELTIVRILIMLFGWRPEDLVGGISATIKSAVDHTVINNNVYTAHPVRGKNGQLGSTAVIPTA